MTTATIGRSASARVARHDRRARDFNDYRLALILDDQLERISPKDGPPKALVSREANREMAPLVEIAVLSRFRGQAGRQWIAMEQARTPVS